MITVTGSTGWFVIRALLDAGLPVHALVRSHASAERLPDGVTEHVLGDMLVPG